MDQILLQKNGKTICWRNLTQEDEEEVERLMKEYCKTEPLTTALYSPELEESMVGEAKVSQIKSFIIYLLYITSKRVTSLRRPSPRHCACAQLTVTLFKEILQRWRALPTLCPI